MPLGAVFNYCKTQVIGVPALLLIWMIQQHQQMSLQSQQQHSWCAFKCTTIHLIYEHGEHRDLGSVVPNCCYCCCTWRCRTTTISLVLQLAPRSYAGAYNSSSIDGKLEVLMQVPKGQQELAKLLVKGEQALLAGTTDRAA